MAVNGGEIKVGQRWRNRSGKVAIVTATINNPTYKFQLSDGNTVTEFGAVWDDGCDDEDLMELIEDTPAVQPPIPTPEVVSETPLERRAQQSALDVQVGGDHYKTLAIQPVEYCHRNGLGFCESSVIKYVTRWKSKNGIKDLEKARHFIDLLIEMEGNKA